jgi:hypothetical protein
VVIGLPSRCARDEIFMITGQRQRITVTTLNDFASGSLRDAINQAGAATQDTVFGVTGIMNVQAALDIDRSRNHV